MRKSLLALVALAVVLAVQADESLRDRIAKDHKVTGEDTWYGFHRVKFNFNGRNAWVVEPSVPAAKGRPWTWTMQWAEAFVDRTGVPALLKRGFHHVTIDLYGTRMNEEGLRRAADFQKFLVTRLGFAPKANLIGMSWGGFFSTRYAAADPKNVAKIYFDAPLLNFDGFGKPDKKDIGPWNKTPPKDGNWTDDPRMPVNMAEKLAAAKIPLFLLYGGADTVVPPEKNCLLFIPRFKAAGGVINYSCSPKRKHHPHGLAPKNQQPIVDFFLGTKSLPDKAPAQYKAAGHDTVTRANAFREKKDFAGGEAFLKEQEALKAASTNLAERQSLQMARFALYRTDDARKDEMVALLRRVKTMDSKSFWGVAAVGWLDWWGVEKAPAQPPAKDPCRPRGKAAEAQGWTFPSGKENTCLVARYLRERVGEKTLGEIAAREGGVRFLRRFFGDEDGMEAFAGSGPADLPAALKALDLLVWNDEGNFIGTKLGRNIAMALALDHGNEWKDAKLVAVMRDYRRWAKDGSLVPECLDQDVHAWREVVDFGQNDELPEEDLAWMHDFAALTPSAYRDLCWSCVYRGFNCFGLDVQKPDYYRPWQHAWCVQECRYRVGGVCGALSKFGSAGAQAHGVRSFTATQPRHCAYLVWDYAKNRWQIAYSVDNTTWPHFTLAERDFASLEEQERYFGHPRRMEAERLRWQGDNEASMRLVPGNWQAANEWRKKLLADPKSAAAEWRRFAAAVLDTFSEAPSEGWNLYLTYLDHLPKTERLAAAEKGLLGIRENPAETAEHPHFDAIALNPLVQRFKDDPAAIWKLLSSALAGAAHSPSFYRQALDWGAARFMKDASSAERFLALVRTSAEATGEKLEFAGMVRQASRSGDSALFAQVFGLARQLVPASLPKANGKSYPREDFGGTFVGAGALVTPSTASRRWENPLNYASLVELDDAAYDNAFHTEDEKAPSVTLKLRGETEVTGLLVVNSGNVRNFGREVPLAVWWSEDGKTWNEAWSTPTCAREWRVPFPSGVKARFIRVGRTPNAKKDFFHLHKVLVYGRKLY